MTREEEIKKIACAFAIDEVKDTCNPASKRGLLYAGFVSGAEWADAHPHWISVEDELPKGFAIITNGDDVLIGKYNFEKGFWGVRNKTMFAYTLLPANWIVTHWMPLPQAPTVAENATVKRKEVMIIRRNELCKHYRSWVGTSKGEINCACVDEEKRTITTCDYTESNGCWKCPKTTMKGGEE